MSLLLHIPLVPGLDQGRVAGDFFRESSFLDMVSVVRRGIWGGSSTAGVILVCTSPSPSFLVWEKVLLFSG